MMSFEIISSRIEVLQIEPLQNTKSRKILQFHKANEKSLIALCDDGSMWEYWRDNNLEWHLSPAPLPTIPDIDDDQPPQA